MPKVGEVSSRPKLPILSTCETRTDDSVLSGAYNSYTNKLSKRVVEPPAIQAMFGKASKPEQSQMLAFIAANAPRNRVNYRWFLTTYTNLDTGRKHATVGYSWNPPGLPLTQFRRLINA